MFKAMFHHEETDLTVYMRRGRYKHKEKCHGDVMNVMAHCRSLRLKFDRHYFNDGSKKDLMYLFGTIPVPHK